MDYMMLAGDPLRPLGSVLSRGFQQQWKNHGAEGRLCSTLLHSDFGGLVMMAKESSPRQFQTVFFPL